MWAASYPLAVMAHTLCPGEMGVGRVDKMLRELDGEVVVEAALAALAKVRQCRLKPAETRVESGLVL